MRKSPKNLQKPQKAPKTTKKPPKNLSLAFPHALHSNQFQTFPPTVKDQYTASKLPRYDSSDVDWDIGMFARIGKVKEYEKWVETPVHRPLRIFDSAFLESMTHCPWWVVPLVWVPVSLYSTYMCYNAFNQDILTTIVLFAAGIIIWTFLEYALHRFLFHLPAPDNGPVWRKYTQFIAHGLQGVFAKMSRE